MQAARKVPRWFWIAWPLASVVSVVTTIGWPAAEAASMPLVLGALWLVARRMRGVGPLVVHALIVGAVASLLITVLLPVRVEAASGLSSVAFGWPLPWLTQDLTWMDAPGPPGDVLPSSINRSGMPDVSHAAWGVNILVCSLAGGALLLLARRRPASRPVPRWFWVAWAGAAWFAAAFGPAPQLALAVGMLGIVALVARRFSTSVQLCAHALIGGVAASVLVLTLAPVRVSTAAGLGDVRFGWPFQWLSQDLGHFAQDPLPAAYSASGFARTTDILVLPWLGAIAVFAAVAGAAVLAVRRLRPAPPSTQPSLQHVDISA